MHLPGFLSASLAIACLLAAGCSDPATEQLKKTTIPTYDQKTGRLTELTFDLDKNGKIDTWTQMDGPRPVLTRTDRNEDGKVDRWEYFDGNRQVEKVGFSRGDTGTPDAWAFAGPDGKVQKVEISSTADIQKIDRWEFYDAGGLLRAEEDTNHDGKPDKWDTYEAGILKSVAFDDSGDGVADRRFTYAKGKMVLFETGPDGKGGFTRHTKAQ